MNQQHIHDRKQPALSVLTEPLPLGVEYFVGIAKVLVRLTRKLKNNKSIRYGGHPSVTRSLVEGLQGIGADFNYNPKKKINLGRDVVVLSGVHTLNQVIKLKQLGLIERIFAGPNIVVRSTDYDSIIASPEIDFVITPSSWVSKAYIEETPSLISRCIEWAAGVDTEFWRSDPSIERTHALIFTKPQIGLIPDAEPYVAYLKDNGFAIDFIEYGSFTQEDYRSKLNRAKFLLGFVASESQGIAWAEAWAMGTPTLIWKNKTNLINAKIFETSAAPYLTESTGRFFSNFNDFKVQILDLINVENKSRQWVESNMSDEVCAKILLKKLNSAR